MLPKNSQSNDEKNLYGLCGPEPRNNSDKLECILIVFELLVEVAIMTKTLKNVRRK